MKRYRPVNGGYGPEMEEDQGLGDWVKVDDIADLAQAALQRLADIKDNAGDLERDHGEADDALLDFIKALGFPAIADAFDAIDKWYA